ncbi:hypothetical protein [Streptomyces sp. DHE17-7]|uniref:hypothetical protein n=1 Tax=Streptomyces sp. DHE17-7 TaxID=2759949 RepID=UPI003FA70C42
MANIESRVVWSSASRVTVVPIAAAASTTGRTFFRASSWPPSSAWAEHGQLHGHLGAGAEVQRLEPVDQLQVRVAGGLGLLGGGDVLADDVHRQLQALVGQLPDDRDDLVDRLAGDEPVDDRLGHGRGGDQPTHPVAAGRGENHGTQHGAPPLTNQHRAVTRRFGNGTENHREI